MQLLHFPDKPHLQNLLTITLGRDNLKEAAVSDVFACEGYLNNHKINFMARKTFHLLCQYQLMQFRKIVAGYWRTARNT